MIVSCKAEFHLSVLAREVPVRISLMQSWAMAGTEVGSSRSGPNPPTPTSSFLP